MEALMGALVRVGNDDLWGVQVGLTRVSKVGLKEDAELEQRGGVSAVGSHVLTVGKVPQAV